MLTYWFGRRPVTEAGPELVKKWFMGGKEIDDEITTSFGSLVESCLSPSDGLKDWESTMEGTCAKIVLADQFTRNMWRSTPAAFSGDKEALRLCEMAISKDWLFTPEYGYLETMVSLLPIEHSEDIEIHRRYSPLFSRMVSWVEEECEAGRVSESMIEYAKGSLKAFEEHTEIVERFGRYPHRNETLGRASTDEEREYLAGDAPTFGQ